MWGGRRDNRLTLLAEDTRADLRANDPARLREREALKEAKQHQTCNHGVELGGRGVGFWPQDTDDDQKHRGDNGSVDE